MQMQTLMPNEPQGNVGTLEPLRGTVGTLRTSRASLPIPERLLLLLHRSRVHNRARKAFECFRESRLRRNEPVGSIEGLIWSVEGAGGDESDVARRPARRSPPVEPFEGLSVVGS